MPRKPIFDQATLAAIARERTRLQPVLELRIGDRMRLTETATIAGARVPAGAELIVERASGGTLDLRHTSGVRAVGVPVDQLADCQFERIPAPDDEPF